LRILVSGGSGFVGSHLCDHWLAEGHEVIAVDNFITGRPENVAHLADQPRFRLIEHDVIEPLALDGALDHIFHLASPASPDGYLAHPLETLLVNSVGTKNMLDLAREKDAGFLLASTSECYGDPLEHPQKETYWGNVNPVGERSCYDESKRFAEAITMAYHREHGVHTNIARIFNTYGPRMALDDGRVVPAFLDQCLRGEPLTVFGDGTQTRSFCFVSDMVEGLCRLGTSEERFPVNLGNPSEMTILEFAERIQRLMESDLPLVYKPLPSDDPKVRQPDIAKAKRVLGWEPRVSLDEGLRETVEYFRSLVSR
jgi:dTDP-glucose 4,6-dehydratase